MSYEGMPSGRPRDFTSSTLCAAPLSASMDNFGCSTKQFYSIIVLLNYTTYAFPLFMDYSYIVLRAAPQRHSCKKVVLLDLMNASQCCTFPQFKHATKDAGVRDKPKRQIATFLVKNKHKLE